MKILAMGALIVREGFIDRSYRGSLGEQGREPSGPMILVSAPAAEPGPSTSNQFSVLEELNQAAAKGASVREPPWRAVARAKERPAYFLAKRSLDVTGAALGLLLLSPLLVVAAVLTRLTSRGPAFFRQERVGYGGRRFIMYKFRSMYVDSDDRLHRAAYEQFLRGERSNGKVDADLLAQEQAKERAPGDPRITPLGNLLRRSSIDELPQLFNVLLGEMSLVGPRPPIPYEVGLYQPWHLARLETLPGMTGFWQIHGRSRVSFDQMVRMDLEYIQNQSFWYDIKLLLLTIPAVLSRKGAY